MNGRIINAFSGHEFIDFLDFCAAAEALVKIRHHRAASGASNRSAPTPAGGSTPRANADTISTMPTLTNQAPSGSRPATQPPSPTKAGALVPPPDLSSVITAVSAMADEQEGAANGDLPTVGPVSPDLASPQGQEGVAQRWWGALSGSECFICLALFTAWWMIPINLTLFHLFTAYKLYILTFWAVSFRSASCGCSG